MSIILNFPKPYQKCAPGEEYYHTVDDNWFLVRIKSEIALSREAERLQLPGLAGDEHRRKLSDPDFSFLSLRSVSGEGATVVSVDEVAGRIDDICHGRGADRSAALRLLAPLVALKGWSKCYYWDHGYLFTTDGKVVSVNALPDPLIVNGDIDIFNRNGISLPSTVIVAGSISLHTSTVSKCPDYISCMGLKVIGSSLGMIATRLKTEGDVLIEMSHISRFAEEALIKGDLIIRGNDQLMELPKVLSVGGSMKVCTSEISDFGDDTLIIGELELLSTGIACRYALDFGGRPIRHGDAIKVHDLPQKDKNGRPIEIEDCSTADAVFTGQFKNDTYSCIILDRKRGVTHPVSLLRHEVSAKRTIRPPSATQRAEPL